MFITKYLIVGFICGFIASGMGLGGGAMINPLFLSLDVPLPNTRVSSSLMVQLTSLTSIVKYYFMGVVDIKYAWIFFVLPLFIFPAGFLLSNYIIKILRTVSVIQFAVASITFVSTCFVVPQVIEGMREVTYVGRWDEFGSFC